MNMRRLGILLFVLAQSYVAMSDLQVISPTVGDVLKGGREMEVRWTESDGQRRASDLVVKSIILHSGGSKYPVSLYGVAYFMLKQSQRH